MSTNAHETIYSAAIIGDRSEQQDSFRSIWIRDEQAWLLIVADGMGGHAAGAVASKVAADAFVESFLEARQSKQPLETALNTALQAANNRIHTSQSASFELRGMGTTLVAAYMAGDTLAWISVGDSPLWFCHAGRMERLNTDHSLRSVLQDNKRGRGNLLTSALTGGVIADVDCQLRTQFVSPGDIVVLASDGLLTLNEPDIETIIRDNYASGPETIGRALMTGVKNRAKPHQDNCSVVVALANRGVATPEPVGTPVRQSSSRFTKFILALVGIAIAVAIATHWLI